MESWRIIYSIDLFAFESYNIPAKFVLKIILTLNFNKRINVKFTNIYRLRSINNENIASRYNIISYRYINISQYR